MDREPRLKIGDTVLLWLRDYSREAYVDQMGIPHEGHLVLEELEIEITEIKEVKASYGTPGPFFGFKAKSADGRTFSQNWSIFPDDAMDGGQSVWFNESSTKFQDWRDAFNTANYKFPPNVRDGMRALPAGAAHCETHDWYSKPGDCWLCRFAVDGVLPKG